MHKKGDSQDKPSCQTCSHYMGERMGKVMCRQGAIRNGVPRLVPYGCRCKDYKE